MSVERILTTVAECLDAGDMDGADKALFRLQILLAGGLEMEEHECDREYALRVRLMNAKLRLQLKLSSKS